LILLLLLIVGFSLNGELMMDRMGQEIAFKGIDLTEAYVPVISLGAGQHAKINFGQVGWQSLSVYNTSIRLNNCRGYCNLCV